MMVSIIDIAVLFPPHKKETYDRTRHGGDLLLYQINRLRSLLPYDMKRGFLIFLVTKKTPPCTSSVFTTSFFNLVITSGDCPEGEVLRAEGKGGEEKGKCGDRNIYIMITRYYAYYDTKIYAYEDVEVTHPGT